MQIGTIGIYIAECETCGQKNRIVDPLPPGKVARCGKCHAAFDDDTDDDTDDDDQ